MTKRERLTKYEIMGLAAMLPGMVHARTVLDADIKRIQDVIALAQENGDRPEQATGEVSAQKAYWARMTPAQRRAEMQRRGMMGRASKSKKQRKNAQYGEKTKQGVPAKMHPRDPRHPGHAAFVEKLRKANKKSWAALTPEQHDARVKASLVGRAGRAA